MNDSELEEVLNRWKAPAPPRDLRARVLASYPRRERPSLGRLLRWGFGDGGGAGVLRVGSAGRRRSAGESRGRDLSPAHRHGQLGRRRSGSDTSRTHFCNSHPKVYVDGELRSRRGSGRLGSGVCGCELPAEGKYLIGLRRTAFEGPVPPRAGRFDGHALEFQAGGRTVRIESNGTYGFHERLPVYVMGPVGR